MKRDDMDIDEMLKRYLPRASQEDVDEASETVLKAIRSMRFQPANAVLRVLKKPPKAEWLLDMHVAVLVAVEQLRGQGRPATIGQRVEELMEGTKAPEKPVLLLLRMMERTGLVSSSPINPKDPEALDKRYFKITPVGRKMIAKAMAARRHGVTDPLKGLT